MTKFWEIVLTAALGAGLGGVGGLFAAGQSYGRLAERAEHLTTRVAALELRLKAVEDRPAAPDAKQQACLDLAEKLSHDFASDHRIKEAMRQSGCKVVEPR